MTTFHVPDLSHISSWSGYVVSPAEPGNDDGVLTPGSLL
jgi:hypothetical protein